MAEKTVTPKLFDNKQIRTIWNETEEEWYFSVIDVIAVLTESQNAASYWRKLKQRLKEEGNETVTNCHGLKLKAADGKQRLTDVANTEQLLRLIQSIPSKKAEPFNHSPQLNPLKFRQHVFKPSARKLPALHVFNQLKCNLPATLSLLK